MLTDEKSEFLRVRVSKETKTAFENYAAELGKTPTDQLREMIDKFINDQATLTKRDIIVSITQPPGYEHGAWRVSIKVLNPITVTWQGRTFGFELPELKNRRILSDQDYIAPILVAGGHIKLGGHFIGGVWQGHIYTNGIEEDRNPTAINIVRDELEKVTRNLIASLSSRDG